MIQKVALLAISKKTVVICFDLLSQYSPQVTGSSTKTFGQLLNNDSRNHERKSGALLLNLPIWDWCQVREESSPVVIAKLSLCPTPSVRAGWVWIIPFMLKASPCSRYVKNKPVCLYGRSACIINLLVFHPFLFLLIYLSCRFVYSLGLLSLSFTFISPFWSYGCINNLWILRYVVFVNDRVDISIVFCERDKKNLCETCTCMLSLSATSIINFNI